MRIILATLGSLGDIKPFLWMGRVFRNNGSEVIFVANPYFEEIIRKEGFAFHPAGTVEDYEQATTPAVTTGSRFRDQGEAIRASRRLFSYMFMKPVKDIYNIITELKNQETFIFHHFYAYGARLAMEKQGIPGRNVCLSPYWLKTFRKSSSLPEFLESRIIKGTSRFIDSQLFTKPMNEIRNGIGLDAFRGSSLEWMFEGETLCLFPDWLVGYRLPDSLNINCIGFPGPVSEEKRLPAEISDFIAQYGTPVVFTPGSAFKDAGGFFEAAVHALERLKKPGIFLTKDSNAIRPALPGNIIHSDFVPLELLLDHCSALVHHGGIGTGYQALKAGIPQVVCYRLDEQKENAGVLKNLGICRTIAYREVSGDSLYENLKALLEDTGMPVKCAEARKMVDGASPEEKLLKIIKNI